jgi:hypothetical protein
VLCGGVIGQMLCVCESTLSLSPSREGDGVLKRDTLSQGPMSMDFLDFRGFDVGVWYIMAVMGAVMVLGICGGYCYLYLSLYRCERAQRFQCFHCV